MKTCIICGTTFSPPPYTNPTVCPDPSCGLECMRRGQAAFREQRKQQRERAKQERKQERERARQAQKRAMAADKAASLLLEQTDDLDAALILVFETLWRLEQYARSVENAEYDVITDFADEAQGACDRAVEHFRAERHGRLDARNSAIKEYTMSDDGR